MTSVEIASLCSALAGLALYCEIPRAGGFRSNCQQRIFGVCMFVSITYQTLNLFTALNDASSLQLFCFIGCTLGSLGSMRLIVNMPPQLAEAELPLKPQELSH